MTAAPIRTHSLPGIDVLKRRFQSPAMLDAIFMPELLFRHYAYNAHWGDGEEMASMHSGGDDTVYALFTPAGAVLKGFECEEPPEKPALFSVLPEPLAGFAKEPAFEPEQVTFCFWRLNSEESWGFIGRSLEAATRLLVVPRDDAHEYVRWAEQYYARPIVRDAVTEIFCFEPLTPELVSKLNADACWKRVTADAGEIGYPLAEQRA